MTSCIKSAFARRIRLLTLKNRFASPLFVIKEELRPIWKFWIARDRFTLPTFHLRVHEATNFAAWSNCIGHWEGGGSSDLVETEKHVAVKFLDLAFRLNSLNPEARVPAHSEQGRHECAVRVSYISAPDTSERFSGLISFHWIFP